MKIAHIGQKGIPATFGGVEFHVQELVQRLVQRGHEVSVYVRSWYTPKENSDFEGSKLIHQATIKTKHLDAFVHSFTSSFHALFSEYDIVHYHALGPTFFCWVPKLSRKKIVATVHGIDWQRRKWGGAAKAFLKLTERTAIHIPAKTIVVSQSLKHYFESKFKVEVNYIPNGVNIPDRRAPSLIKEKYNLNGGDYVLFMGRFVPEKRADWLIEAFQKIDIEKKETPDIKLVLAGGASGTDEYVGRMKIGAQNNERIIFPGYVSGREKEELLSNAKLFVLPSDLEGLPIALLEAMSYGLPSLVSDIPPHLELIRDNEDGFLFKHSDFSSLERKLQDVLYHPHPLDDIGSKARTKVKEEFNWDDVVRATEQIYTDVVTTS